MLTKLWADCVKASSPFVSPGATYHFMASKDDDNTQTSSPIPGPPQHETPIGSTQSPTPLVHSPLSYNIPILAPSPIPLPQPQNPAFTSINEQKQQSSWEASMPHARRRSPDFNHQGVLSPNTPFIQPRRLSGSSSDTSTDDAGENENRNANPSWGPPNSQVSPEGKTVQFYGAFPSPHPISTEQNRPSSWFPPTPGGYLPRRSDLDDQGQRRPITPFIPPLSSPSGPSFDTSNYRAGVNPDYHNSGWYSSNIMAPGPPAHDPITTPYAGVALRYGPSVPWAPAGYPVNWTTPTGAGVALRYDGVRNAGAAWGMATPWVGMATRDDEAVTSTHPTPNLTSAHPTPNPTSTHPTTNSTSTHPITNPSWAVHVYSQTLQIAGERLRRYQIVRSKLRFESQLNDLFSGSLGVWP
jgi:hypothetical protein